MSPTLLELALVIMVLVIAWQLGLALAPTILRQLRALRHEVDEAADAATRSPDDDTLHDVKERTRR